MADNEKTVVEVDVDLDAIESKLKTIDIGLEKVRTEIAADAKNVASSIAQVREAVNLCASSITGVIKEQFDSWTSVHEKANADNSIARLGEKAYDSIFMLLVESMKKIGHGDKPISTAETNRFPSLPPGNADTQGSSKGTNSPDTLGISGLLSSNFGDPMSFAAAMGDLTESFGGVITKLKESVAAWGAQTAAKIADKAEDAAIIAMYVGDFVKAIGGAIAQLAASTAAWVANTAAKAASTAAEWAHIAAVTVWNGICATATAVTTAFNAALAVLTSPITLVIAGITALVAAVVLLVKNWDTVKAVAISTWESIKEAFGSAWSWFKTKVVDPLVNGLKGGVNGIIGFINGLIAGLVKGINSIINMINKLQFAVPDWGARRLPPVAEERSRASGRGRQMTQAFQSQGRCRAPQKEGANWIKPGEGVQMITFLPAFLIRQPCWAANY